MWQLDHAYKNLFRGGGYPRFKSKARFDSFGFAEFSGITLKGGRLRFKGVSGGIKVRFHRPLPEGGKICSCRFKRDHKGWSVSFQVRLPDVPKKEARTHVGIDAGLTALATLSTGEKVENPRVTKTYERRLRLANRALGRCKKGSVRRGKVKQALVRTHAKIAAVRQTYLHQVSARLARTYDLIALEDLNVKGLAQGRLAKSIHDAAWSTLAFFITYKAEGAGGAVVKVDARGTSQQCSGCGRTVPKELSERTHDCKDCGLILCRDTNAARNILHRAVAGPEPRNVAPKGKRAVGSPRRRPR